MDYGRKIHLTKYNYLKSDISIKYKKEHIILGKSRKSSLLEKKRKGNAFAWFS